MTGTSWEGLDADGVCGQWRTTQTPNMYPWGLVVSPCWGALRFGKRGSVRLGMRWGSSWRAVDIETRSSRITWRPRGSADLVRLVSVREAPQKGAYDPFLTSFAIPVYGRVTLRLFSREVDAGCRPHSQPWELHIVRLHVEYRSTPDCAADGGPQAPLGHESGAHTWIMEFPRRVSATRWSVFGEWSCMTGGPQQSIHFDALRGWNA